MPREDAKRWDQRYAEDERFRTFTQPRQFLLEHADWLPEHGLALDVAMGPGGNAAFLLERGLRVVGVDISWVALQRAKVRLPGLMAVQADLTGFYLPPNRFDVILNFYYLQRSLWPEYRRWLKPGGILMIETLTQEMLTIQPEIDPAYLLLPGELLTAFYDLDILAYHEGRQVARGGRTSAVASLVVRMP